MSKGGGDGNSPHSTDPSISRTSFNRSVKGEQSSAHVQSSISGGKSSTSTSITPPEAAWIQFGSITPRLAASTSDVHKQYGTISLGDLQIPRTISFQSGLLRIDGKVILNAKVAAFKDSAHIQKFERFLRYENHKTLICLSESVVSKGNNILFYKGGQCTLSELFHTYSKEFWVDKATNEGVKSFITPQFKNFLNNVVDGVLHLYKYGFTHGALGDPSHYVFMAEGSLDSLKMIPCGENVKDYEVDRTGLLNLMEQLKPGSSCLYYEDLVEFIKSMERRYLL